MQRQCPACRAGTARSRDVVCSPRNLRASFAGMLLTVDESSLVPAHRGEACLRPRRQRARCHATSDGHRFESVPELCDPWLLVTAPAGSRHDGIG